MDGLNGGDDCLNGDVHKDVHLHELMSRVLIDWTETTLEHLEDRKQTWTWKKQLIDMKDTTNTEHRQSGHLGHCNRWCGYQRPI